MKRLILLATMLVMSQLSFAVDSKVINTLIKVCKDHNGRKVDFVFHQDIQSYAYASTHQEGDSQNKYIPVIHVNTRFFKWISSESQAFVLAHECAHHALGHVAQGGGSEPGSEFEADCYATRLLYKLRIIDSQDDLLKVEEDFFRMGGDLPSPRSSSHPGTIERFDNVNECFLRYAR